MSLISLGIFQKLPKAFRVTWRKFLRRNDRPAAVNVLKAFPLHRPVSSGSLSELSDITIASISRTIPLLATLANFGGKAVHEIDFALDFPSETESMQGLKELFDAYGSDKGGHHGYHLLYGELLEKRESVQKILEIGLGSNNIGLVSNMGANGKPGASVRAFRDFCPNAQIFGADVDKTILFSEERIDTFHVDQTDQNSLGQLFDSAGEGFNLVIDDGLHAPHANLLVLINALPYLTQGGSVVIEDISPEATPLWRVVNSLLPKPFEAKLYKFPKGSLAFVATRTS